MRSIRRSSTVGSTFKKASGVGITAVLLVVPSANESAETSPGPDACEREALKAYAQVLEFCRLAENDDPRLRCYERARAVFFETLEECRRRKR